MKKVAIILIVCALLSTAAYFVYLNKLKPSLKSSNSVSLDNTKFQNKVSFNESEKKDQPEVLKQPGKKTFSAGEEVIEGNDVSVLAVDFDGNSFVPTEINIKANDWIFFRNNSLKNISLISLQNSSFKKYPGFDSKTSILPQKSYKFQFKIPGLYGIAESINQDLVVIVKVSE